MENISIT